MARRRRTPTSPIAWLLGVIISITGSYAVYRVSVSAIKDLGQHQIEKAQAAQQKIQQQQLARQQQVASQPQPTISSEERARQQVAARLRQAELAAAARTKEEAWARFYQPPYSCIYPESNKRAAVCDAAESRNRKQFEADWAAEQLQTQR